MKRITVGRDKNCDIVIIDETDNISRHHLVITFNFFGKMKVSDTSSNGTFINGTRMLKGTSIPVTIEDKIRLGRNINLDWNLVKDPYKPVRIAVIGIISVLIVTAFFIWGWIYYQESYPSIDNNKIEVITTDIELDNNWNKDSTAKVAPTVTSIEVKNQKKSSSKEINRKKKDAIKVSKPKEKTVSSINKVEYLFEENNEIDSVAVF